MVYFMLRSSCIWHVDKESPGDADMGFLTDIGHGRAMIHAGIANSVVGETFPEFPAHVQPTILRIW